MADGAMRAVGAFNPTAQPIGFLQPLFAGPQGDNQTYVQRFRSWARIDGFDAVAWPERDTVMFDEPIDAVVGGECLWSFLLPDQSPLILPWEAFRADLSERLDEPVLNARPLLLFDIVQTLGLEDRKPDIYAGAFRAYARAGRDVAERWRDREILGPLLLHALIGHAAQPEANDEIIPLADFLRARVDQDIVRVTMRDRHSPALTVELERAYSDIARRFPEIFPQKARVKVDKAPPRATSQPISFEPAAVTVVLVGKLRDRQRSLPGLDRRDIEIVPLDELASHRARSAPSPLYLLVGTQTEWRNLVDGAAELAGLPAIAVMLSVSTTPLVRDMDFRRESSLPSVSIFTPSGSRDHSDALKSVQPLIDALNHVRTDLKRISGLHGLPAEHNVFLRAEIRPNHDPVETCCRLGARALRAGVEPGARTSIFVEHAANWSLHHDYGQILEILLAIPYPTQTEFATSGRSKNRTPSSLMLLVARDELRVGGDSRQLTEGIDRLFMMRGWQVKRNNGQLTIASANRQFAAVIVDRKDEIPTEVRGLNRAAFGQAHMLVIHIRPRRETLLVGNRGEFCHIAIDDIGLMEPETDWLWPVLRRQLMIPSSQPMLAALKLAAAIAGEAIRLGRFETKSDRWPVDDIRTTLEEQDCERFIDFAADGITRSVVLLHVRLPNGLDRPQHRPDPILRLRIEDDGPLLIID